MRTRFLLCITLLVIFNNGFAIESLEDTCYKNKEIQKLRSKELWELAQADQAEREAIPGEMSEHIDMWLKLNYPDLVRRRRVGELFGEGCILTGRDYLSAAMIYQHGNLPDHYFQAFLWSKKAAELGEKSAKGWVAMTIDRYLVSTGKKQLFATQYYKNSESPCYCLYPVEMSFPEDRRLNEIGVTLSDAIEQLNELNQGENCPMNFCDKDVEDTPAGSIVGFW